MSKPKKNKKRSADVFKVMGHMITFDGIKTWSIDMKDRCSGMDALFESNRLLDKHFADPIDDVLAKKIDKINEDLKEMVKVDRMVHRIVVYLYREGFVERGDNVVVDFEDLEEMLPKNYLHSRRFISMEETGFFDGEPPTEMD